MSSDSTPNDNEQPSYLWAMLSSPLNINSALLTLAGSTFLSIPFGLAGAALPLLAFAAGEAIAAMFVPSAPAFRSHVDRRHALVRRARAAEHLRTEIQRRSRDQDPRWAVYARLRERIDSLEKMAKHRRRALGQIDLDRLENASLDFLGLWLAHLSMVERQESVNEEAVEKRIVGISQQIDNGAADTRSLQKARADLEELLLRHRRLASRKAAVEAALLSLPDAVEEIYYAAITTPASGENGARLQEAIDRLRLEEELENSFGAEIRAVLPAAASRIVAARQ